MHPNLKRCRTESSTSKCVRVGNAACRRDVTDVGSGFQGRTSRMNLCLCVSLVAAVFVGDRLVGDRLVGGTFTFPPLAWYRSPGRSVPAGGGGRPCVVADAAA
jgi:hypothetical protein